MNIGYIRVSTREQSTARQLDGIKLDQVYEDKISGVLRDRPNLNICMQVLRQGDTLYIHSMCRLARSLRDLLEIVDILVKRGVTIKFHTEGLTFTAIENPFATMQMQILASVAQFERTISKSRQREGINIAKSKGTRSGKPFGKQPLDMTRRPEAISLSMQGLNISQIAKAMKLSRPSISKLLS